MTLEIQMNKTQHRFTSPVKPSFTFSGFGSSARFMIRDYLYEKVAGSKFTWFPPNATNEEIMVTLRDTVLSTWTLSEGIANDANDFSKTGTDSFSGATASEITTGNCSIEGEPGYFGASTVLALQSGTASFDYVTTDAVEHAMVFDQGGKGVVREKGVIKERFEWVLGDSGLVEQKDGIVRYYHVKQDGKMVLLRSKRSMLTFPVTPTIVLYHTNAEIKKVRIWTGDETEKKLELYAVLSDFQDWRNQGSFESNGEKTTNKDKTEDVTYFSTERNLMNLSISVGWDEEDKYREILEFYKYHDISKVFLFIDNARKIEFWAKFTSGFSDNPLGAGIFGMAAEIRQVPDPPLIIDDEPDLSPPSISFTLLGDSPYIDQVSFELSAADQNSVASIGLRIDGEIYASVPEDSHIFTLDVTEFSEGIHSVQGIAADTSGNTAISNFVSLQMIVDDLVDEDDSPLVDEDGETLHEFQLITI